MRTCLNIILIASSLTNPFGAAGLANTRPNEVWIWPSAYRDSFRKTPPTEGILLLQRHCTKSGAIEARGPAPWSWPAPSIQIVFRFESRPQPKIVAAEYFKLLNAWESKGVRITGLQLDYDSPTAKLGFYKADIAAIRDLISLSSPSSALSVTGLTDWLTLKDFDTQFNRDVVVYFQLYRETQEHREAEMNLTRLSRAKFPFKIGLLPHQTLSEAQRKLLVHLTQFKGTAIFHGGREI